jgi:hypothetical protein
MHASGSISVTAIDSRSATSSTFVSEALRIAFQDAINAGLVSADMAFDIRNLHDPISAPDYVRAIGELQDGNACIVLVFDQFEELFSKEDLFDAFSAIRELCLTVDALQIPVILGFSWKTDISLPQEHPAYHLWHELTDRRKSFKIREFRDSDVKRIITKAEHSSGKRLSPALRARLIEQCQGLPWLLKKLLVHVLQRVSTPESQFHLLERELDIELLFKEDLAQLSDEAVKCLTYVAEHAPVPVPDVEINFARETTNFLINLHLLVRSGMNYVVYWDIFRDYLVEGRIPTIPWSKMFQRDPTVPVRALSTLKSKGALSIHNLAEEIRLRDRPCMNVVGDLVALQLVESDGSGNYSVVGHLESTDPVTIAGYVQRQLKRHVIVQAMDELWPREVQFDHDAWVDFFVRVHPRAAEFSAGTVRQYANTFRRWLIFAGLLEQHDHWLRRSTGSGRQIGILASARASPGTFLGVAAPDAVVRVVEMVRGHGGRMKRGALDAAGLRNATTDAVALGLVIGTDEAGVELVYPFVDRAEIHSRIRDAVVRQRTFQLIAAHDPLARGLDGELGTSLQALVGTKWKPASVKRYLGGLRQYLRWLNELKEGIRSGASE